MPYNAFNNGINGFNNNLNGYGNGFNGYGGYNNGFGGNFNGQPAPDQLAQLKAQYSQPQTQPINNGIMWVSNRKEADEYPLAVNSAVALWDSNSPVIYFKQSDSSGRPSMKVFDLVERDAQPAAEPPREYVTRAEFESLQTKVDSMMTAKAKKGEKENA